MTLAPITNLANVPEYVLGLNTCNRNNLQITSRASAFLITPNFALSAAHNFRALPTGQDDLGSFTVNPRTTNIISTFPYGNHAGSSIVLPDYNPQSLTNGQDLGDDLAIVEFNGDTGSAAPAQLIIFQDSFDAVRYTDRVTLYGYNSSGQLLTGTGDVSAQNLSLDGQPEIRISGIDTVAGNSGGGYEFDLTLDDRNGVSLSGIGAVHVGDASNIPVANPFGLSDYNFIVGNLQSAGVLAEDVLNPLIILSSNFRLAAFDGTYLNETIYGGNFTQTINAKQGNDTIFGSLGNDTLSGGSGIDTLDYSTYAGGGVRVTFGSGGRVGVNLKGFTKALCGVLIGLSFTACAGGEPQGQVTEARSSSESVDSVQNSTKFIDQKQIIANFQLNKSNILEDGITSLDDEYKIIQDIFEAILIQTNITQHIKLKFYNFEEQGGSRWKLIHDEISSVASLNKSKVGQSSTNHTLLSKPMIERVIFELSQPKSIGVSSKSESSKLLLEKVNGDYFLNPSDNWSDFISTNDNKVMNIDVPLFTLVAPLENAFGYLYAVEYLEDMACYDVNFVVKIEQSIKVSPVPIAGTNLHLLAVNACIYYDHEDLILKSFQFQHHSSAHPHESTFRKKYTKENFKLFN